MDSLNNKPLGTKDIWAINICLFAFTFSQFFELSLINTATIDLTVQRLACFIIYPITILLLGKIRINFIIIMIFLTVYTTLIFGYVRTGFEMGNLLNISLNTIMNLLTTIVLITILSLSKYSFKVLAKYWVLFTVLTSIVAILQTFGYFPLLNVPSELRELRETSIGLTRGVGFKNDPNFTALMLLIGIVFLMFYYDKLTRTIGLLVAFAGILSTFSRMGIILFIIIIIISTSLKSKRKIMPIISSTLIVSILVFLGLIVLPDQIKDFIITRFSEFESILSNMFHSQDLQANVSSGQTRLFLIFASLIIFKEYLLTGVGAYNSKDVFYQYFAVDNVAHNTYLEFLVLGGIWGVLFILMYFLIFQHTKRKIKKVWKENIYQSILAITLLLMMIYFFLSLPYNIIIYLPLILLISFKNITRKGDVYEKN